MGEPKLKSDRPEKKDLNQFKLKEEDLTSGEYPSDEIFILKVDDEVLGTFWQYDIRSCLQEKTLSGEDVWIKSIQKNQDGNNDGNNHNDNDKDNWLSLFDHPFFQRRRPQVVSEEMATPKGQSYYILDQGQKTGPLSLGEIKEKVHLTELILTDVISLDHGSSWVKIYDLPEFNRRNQNRTYLPHSPEKEVLSHSKPEVRSRLKLKKNDIPDFIANLAYLGKNKGQMIDEEGPRNEGPQKKSKKKWFFLSMLIIISMVIISFIFKDQNSPAPILKTKIKQKTMKIHKAKVIKESKKSYSRPKKVQRKIKNKVERKNHQRAIRKVIPFEKSNTYKRSNPVKDNRFREVENNRNDNGPLYDDGQDPVELDPIRRTLSKDNIDPQLEDSDDLYSNKDEELTPDEQLSREEENEEDFFDKEVSY